jgi:hypothetical protein
MPVLPKPPPSIDRLRELFSFNPETGLFTRIVKRWGFPSGTVAGSKQRNGYVYMLVDRRRYSAHRLAWFWVYGQWPPGIDHINRVRSDNRIANLRPATPALSAMNRKPRVDNRSGVTGVAHLDACRLNPWYAHITVNSKRVTLGYFASKEQAVAVRNAALQVEMAKRLFKVAEQPHGA